MMLSLQSQLHQKHLQNIVFPIYELVVVDLAMPVSLHMCYLVGVVAFLFMLLQVEMVIHRTCIQIHVFMMKKIPSLRILKYVVTVYLDSSTRMLRRKTITMSSFMI